MVTFHSDYCEKCKRVNPITFSVEPPEAWKMVVLNRWRRLCPSCFDQEAQTAGVAYTFGGLEGTSWSDRPAPHGRSKRKR